LLLLSARSDYQTFLEPLGVPPLDQNRNWLQVPAFIESAAKTFLKAPETGLKIPEERLRRVIREASAADGTRGLIRPIILNMLGLVLRRIADSPEAERPTRTLLAQDLREFIDHPDRRAIARAILPHMLTDADTKHPRSIGELCSATKLDAHLIHGCLLQLGTSGYVRQISRSDRILNRVWEVSHDFVARLLGPILKNPFRTFWEHFGRVFYPLSIGAWAVAAGFLIFAVPWIDLVRAERTLRDDFGVDIRKNSVFIKASSFFPTLSDLKSDRLRLHSALTLVQKLSPRDLNLSRCRALTNVDGLKDFRNLRTLSLANTNQFPTSAINELQKQLPQTQIIYR